MNIVWLSANVFGYELLKYAVKIPGLNFSGIVTLSDTAKTVMYDGVPAKNWHTFEIPVHEIENINNDKDIIQKLNPDIVVMCGWRQIIDDSVINIPKKGFIGFHPTLLPIGRGSAPIINSILPGFG